MTKSTYNRYKTLKNVFIKQPFYTMMLAFGIFGMFASEWNIYQDPNLLLTIGIAFISSSVVGLVMAWHSDRIASTLHERFDEQNEIMKSNHKESMSVLNKMVDVLEQIKTELKEIKESSKPENR